MPASQFLASGPGVAEDQVIPRLIYLNAATVTQRKIAPSRGGGVRCGCASNLTPVRSQSRRTGGVMFVGSKKTVMIVEDDEALAYAISRHLENIGYQTISVPGSNEAFRELDRGRSVDLVIADVKLGVGEPHGISLGRVLRNRLKDLPVIILTGFPEILEQEGPLPGRVFVKPIDLAALAAEVATALT
jgi:CheY-like chemotaxis protein